ncbi:MAG TPA: hypothetical protein VH597_03830 [Verrucomicrobiae bacterium]|jgi:hypothetical protein|nr:hypothetical protein [Verrucomicrobiae bacterium]
MKSALLIIPFLFLLGCASADKSPQIQPREVTASVTGDKSMVFKKALFALFQDGYSIASSDESSGFISTQRRQMALTPTDVDIGSTMGIDYMKDKRTTVYVTVTIQVRDGSAVIRTGVDAEYLPNDPVYGKHMTGVSRGTIENRIASLIIWQ